jgi:hypothetical protein
VIRIMTESVLAVVCLIPLANIQPARAQALPKGEEILDKYLEATGGKAAYEKCKNRVEKGTVEIVGTGVKGELIVYTATPNKMRSVINLPGFGQIEEGINGKVAWVIDPMRGPRLKEGEEKASAILRAALDADSDWRKYFKKAECVSEDSIDGKPCYKVVLTTNDDQVMTHYYDKTSYLLAKSEQVEKTASGDLPMELYFSDYKKVDGVLLPFKTREKADSMEFVIALDKVEHNVKVPDSRFNLPEVIKKLADKAKK